jgi:hypothetical protein
MEKIIAIGIYSISANSGDESSGLANFTVAMENDLQAEVSVDYEKNTINTTIKNIQVSDGFTDAVKNLKSYEFIKIPDNYQEEVIAISTNLSTATRRVLSLIKYYLQHSSIPESLFAVKQMKWGNTMDCPYQLPSIVSISLSGMRSIQPLRQGSIEAIQSSLNNKIKPLVAMAYLHRAQAENTTRFKWIDATIAAELAVKEVLFLKKPELEVLLMEMPSPPLNKLYGPILEEYLGEKSPYLKQIIKGVEKRNHLVHKPNELKLDPQEANNYVMVIEAAIFHLLSKLYPNELLIQSAYKRASLNIENAPKQSIEIR